MDSLLKVLIFLLRDEGSKHTNTNSVWQCSADIFVQVHAHKNFFNPIAQKLHMYITICITYTIYIIDKKI